MKITRLFKEVLRNRPSHRIITGMLYEGLALRIVPQRYFDIGFLGCQLNVDNRLFGENNPPHL